MKQINIDGFYIGNNSMVFRPVDCVATSNINTASIVGNTIAGVLVTVDTRVLLTAQTNNIQNGIYLNNARTIDLKGDENGYGLIAYDVSTDKFWICNASKTTIIDTNALTFTPLNILDNTITNPTVGQILTYNGTNWVNTTYNTAFNIPIAEVSWQGAGTYTLTLSTLNTWYKISPTTTFTNNNSVLGGNFWNSSTSARINYLPNATNKFCFCQSSFSFLGNLTGQNIECAIYINGTILNKSITRQRLSAITDIQVVSLNNLITLNRNDYVEIYVRNITIGGGVCTFYNFNILIHEMTSYY